MSEPEPKREKSTEPRPERTNSSAEPKPSRTPSALEKVLSSSNLKGGKKKAKDEVAAQTENVNTPGTIWYAIKNSDRETALKVVRENPDVLNSRGPVGDTPVHLCFLFNAPEQKEIGKTLIKEFPQCITATYESDLYHGETVLHIAIVNKDLPTVKWLVKQNAQLIHMRADGKFFQGDSACYYGEYPLAFAACTNNIPMVRFLITAGGDLYAADTSGNTLLHMCVVHSHQRMYSYILEEEKKAIEKELKAKGTETSSRPLLASVRNKEGYTPLTLAALRGDKDMFDFIFQQSKENQWTYGPVSCNIYPLWELDTLRQEPPAGEKEEEAPPSSLEIIVNEEHLELLMLPRIVDLLHSKWKAYAGKYFYKRCATTTFYVIVLSMAVVLRSPNFTYTSDWHDVLRIICEIFVVLGWLYKGYKEMNELFSSGWKYFNQAGSAFIENNLSFAYLLFLPIAIFCEAGGSNGKYFFVFFAVLFVWTYELTLLLGFRLTGPFVIMLYKMWGHDIARFAAIYALVLIGHTSAWYVIAMPDALGQCGCNDVFHEWFLRLKRNFLILFGQISFEEFADEMTDGFAWLSSVLLFFHIIFVFIMLLNVLIGMMGDTFHDIKERSDQEWHLAYAQIIFSIESEIPKEKLQKCDYWTLVNDKRYLQVQDVSKEYFQEVVEEPAESFTQTTLALFDKNKDGVIDQSELQAAREELENKGISLDLEHKEREHVAVLEDMSNIGPQDKLRNRYDGGDS